MKLAFHWTSAVQKHYQKNVIIGDLHRVENLSSNFNKRMIRDKCIKVGYHFHFINSIIDGSNQEKEDLLTPTIFNSNKEKKLPSKFLFSNKTKISFFLVLLTEWKSLLTIK